MNPQAARFYQRKWRVAIAMALWVNGAAVADQVAVCPYVPTLAPPTECGPVDTSLFPHGVNNLGQWVGHSSDCDHFNEFAIKWTPESGTVALTVPSDTFRSIAYGINDSGTAVGVRYTLAAGNDHAYIWLGGQGIEIPGDGGGASSANAVNNSNWVVGERSSNEPGAFSMGFVWRNGELTLIDPRPFGRPGATCADVADSGWVCGYFWRGSNPTSLAFRHKDGATELLALPPGAISSFARGIDSSGLTVGACGYPFAGPVSGFGLPTVWLPSGEARTLALPAGGYNAGVCNAIGAEGVVLGLVYKITSAGTSQIKYVVWLGGKPHFLSDLIEPVSGVSFSTPSGMSDARHIVGTGGYPGTSGGGWLLTPVSAPADLNGDCVVDGMDLASLLAQWGPANGTTNADFDLNGEVDGGDLGVVLGSWTLTR